MAKGSAKDLRTGHLIKYKKRPNPRKKTFWPWKIFNLTIKMNYYTANTRDPAGGFKYMSVIFFYLWLNMRFKISQKRVIMVHYQKSESLWMRFRASMFSLRLDFVRSRKSPNSRDRPAPYAHIYRYYKMHVK